MYVLTEASLNSDLQNPQYQTLTITIGPGIAEYGVAHQQHFQIYWLFLTVSLPSVPEFDL